MKKNSTKAFSLIELVVYIGISALVVLVLSATIIEMSRVYGRSRLYRSISENGNNAIQKISYEIKDASSVNLAESNFTTPPNSLVLNEAGERKRFWVAADSRGINRLYYSSETSDPPDETMALTSGDIEVDNLAISYSPASGDATSSLRITLTLSDYGGKYNLVENFTTTANLRIY